MLGIGIIAAMDIGAGWRCLGVLLWLLSSGRELFVITSGYKRFRCIRIYETGELQLLDANGNWCNAKALSGSIVLRRFAWLRLAPQGGRPYAELLCRERSESEAWRRFQVIWRHLGARA